MGDAVGVVSKEQKDGGGRGRVAVGGDWEASDVRTDEEGNNTTGYGEWKSGWGSGGCDDDGIYGEERADGKDGEGCWRR